METINTVLVNEIIFLYWHKKWDRRDLSSSLRCTRDRLKFQTTVTHLTLILLTQNRFSLEVSFAIPSPSSSSSSSSFSSSKPPSKTEVSTEGEGVLFAIVRGANLKLVLSITVKFGSARKKWGVCRELQSHNPR
jgi:hypothetical protein